ncbi:GntR family transcriptional regulator/MocR family aminotransferase [Aminobacter lissarensis]|uniref:GntR family transcriptional regulator/MocR family aminotransferase n=1 Tax=Aminobacter carboxidus TaxID=376165 RepID=A0A8E2BFB1_9HYPH|nr:PLP-dependent aminotransferase family protein [Aminobacter lissarensis]MBB6468562.1 GntR family transcriptional regulator/MocR family aminotransferase [Aminobacter lissarensis]
MAENDRNGGMGARKIYETLRDQIVGGVYGADGLLPSSRVLATELNVSRTTVTVAYEQLIAEGFIDVRQGARPRVAPAVVHQDHIAEPRQAYGATRLSSYGERLKMIGKGHQERHPSLIVDFKYGDLALSDFPILAWKRAVVAAMANSPGHLSYSDPKGSRRLRTALQGYLWRARTLRCEPEQIIIVNGSQQGLDICARLLLNEDENFVIENPCYTSARHVFRATGATLVPVNVDKDGMETHELAATEARLAYVTPSHQYPLGGVMPIGRRHQLLSWARQCDAYIIEDDYDGEYRYDINPVPPLYGLESYENVIYLGTISKTLSPALRLGYLVVPSQLHDVFAMAKYLADRHTPTMEQEALAALIESGAYERHVRRARRRNGERREALLAALRHRFGDRIIIEGADAGLHVVVWFRDLHKSMEGELVEEARTRSVGIYTVTSLYEQSHPTVRPDQAGLVLGYAALSISRIERGVQLLGQAIDEIQARDSSGSRQSASSFG